VNHRSLSQRPGRDLRSRCGRLIRLAGRPRTVWERTTQARLSRYVPDPQRLWTADLRRDRPYRRPGRVSRLPVSDRPGHVRGQHYPTFAPEICRLVKLQKLQAAEILLRELIEASEAEARLSGMGWPRGTTGNSGRCPGSRGHPDSIPPATRHALGPTPAASDPTEEAHGPWDPPWRPAPARVGPPSPSNVRAGRVSDRAGSDADQVLLCVP
jgi:hypothetical protein